LENITGTQVNNTENSKQTRPKDLEEFIIDWRMNGKKGSFEINIPPEATKSKLPGTSKEGSIGAFSSCKAWIWSVWEFVKEDSNRVKFALKVGLAVLLVSLLILFRAPYDIFGTNIIWSILTVAIMFEYTVGKYMITIICRHMFMGFCFFACSYVNEKPLFACYTEKIKKMSSKN